MTLSDKFVSLRVLEGTRREVKMAAEKAGVSMGVLVSLAVAAWRREVLAKNERAKVARSYKEAD